MYIAHLSRDTIYCFSVSHSYIHTYIHTDDGCWPDCRQQFGGWNCVRKEWMQQHSFNKLIRTPTGSALTRSCKVTPSLLLQISSATHVDPCWSADHHYHCMYHCYTNDSFLGQELCHAHNSSRLVILSSLLLSLDPFCQKSPSTAPQKLKHRKHLFVDWAGITFFYESPLSNPHNIRQLTDTAPFASFGGLYSQWWLYGYNGYQFHGKPR